VPHTDFRTAIQGSHEIGITVTGRASGRPISFPIWFALDGNILYLIPVKGSETEWYKNLRNLPSLRLESHGKALTAHARFLTDQTQLDKVLERFQQKYGRNVKSYYPTYDVAVEVTLE
jgi:deazaflavin-dependent oxidoreductase (nitroreductase family)